MFVFEDITQLDDRSVQLVLRQVDTKDLAVALKGVRPDVRDLLLRNMSTRAAQNPTEEIDTLGPVRLKSVERSDKRRVGKECVRPCRSGGAPAPEKHKHNRG